MTLPVLRPFQAKLKGDVFTAWNQGARNVVMRLDTGGGKTVTLSDIVRAHPGASCIIAHRSELVAQLSLTLARYEVRHNIIASDATRKSIARLHSEELGQSWLDTSSRCVVASVDTLVRAELPAGWAASVTLWIVDEGHHLVMDNKWHRAISLFSNEACRGLLPTATPCRADGKGLGRPEHGGHGVADVMVQGPPMRWLIDQGFLTDYRIICPASDMPMLKEAGASGDFSTAQLREAAKASRIVGDVVKSYLQYGAGKLWITFAPDSETAAEMTTAYRLSGVRAELLTGKTDAFVRRAMLKRFAAHQIDMIVAIDIVSEGFDLPAIEGASFARQTESLPLYMQQFGRTLRPLPGKGKAIILDHVRNLLRHQGPPDKPREWSLLSTRDHNPSDGIPMRVCAGKPTATHPEGGCLEPYERIFKECPRCGYRAPPAERSSPGAVDGDMAELDPEVLAGMRGAVAALDMSVEEKRVDLLVKHAPAVSINAHLRRHGEAHDAQARLRAAMDIWGGAMRAKRALGVDELQRLFWFTFNIDVVSAQALRPKEAEALREKIMHNLG